MLGMVLTDQRLPSRAIGIGLVVLTVLVIGGATANGLRYEVPQNATATMTLTEVPGTADKRMVTADVRINPPDLISDDPNWVSVLGWQGGLANERGIFIDHLDRLGPGHYRSTATDARVRKVEDAVARPRRPDPDRGADLSGRRSRYRRARRFPPNRR